MTGCASRGIHPPPSEMTEMAAVRADPLAQPSGWPLRSPSFRKKRRGRSGEAAAAAGGQGGEAADAKRDLRVSALRALRALERVGA